MIRVAVLGACGKMGRETVKAVCGASDMKLVGACDVSCVGQQIGELVGVSELEITVDADFAAMLERAEPNVVVDFAKPFVIGNTRLAMDRGVVPVVGTTGQSSAELAEIEALTDKTGTAAMVIPNFAIGAVLMMKFAGDAARYMPSAEIVELHHDQKADAPSGTAVKTAEMIALSRQEAHLDVPQPAGPKDHPARGDVRNGVHVHSVRLPGLVAHQKVLFGGQGQILTIQHDSMDRTSFMPGVLLAIRRAANVRGFIYGLDKLL